MSDFFKTMWKKGIRILFVLVLIWIIFFLINFFYPNFFNFFKSKNYLPGQNIEQKETIPLRFRIYNLFFRNSIQNSFNFKNSTNTSSTTEEILAYKNQKNRAYIWGSESTTTIRNKNRLNREDLYIYANKDNSVVEDFKIDGILVKEKGINNFNQNSIITGNIDIGYLSSYYFMVYIYDSNGDFLYNVLGNSYKDIKNQNILNITAINNKNNDLANPRYIGDGFMVIWSDNLKVESIFITKIKIN